MSLIYEGDAGVVFSSGLKGHICLECCLELCLPVYYFYFSLLCLGNRMMFDFFGWSILACHPFVHICCGKTCINAIRLKFGSNHLVDRLQ